MIAVNATEARNKFLELINRAGYGQERIRIKRHGKLVAAIISCEDLARLEALEDAIESAALKKAMAESEGLISIEELLSDQPLEE
ncbi:MAG: type II toxin-antitoxin system Phd/YefM family antitoxin [Xenococcaceae cyanobacterium MO_188.B19]|nr:type II toxin-antitoxin system Phd/YefM family antitoxin [Xenococcaceae cyanobacterium MO_188.B19]